MNEEEQAVTVVLGCAKIQVDEWINPETEERKTKKTLVALTANELTDLQTSKQKFKSYFLPLSRSDIGNYWGSCREVIIATDDTPTDLTTIVEDLPTWGDVFGQQALSRLGDNVTVIEKEEFFR